MEKIKLYHRALVTKGNKEGNVDDITWNDLNMDDVFELINNNRSYIGEQVLYHRLHQTREFEKNCKIENMVAFYRENPCKKKEMEKQLRKIGKNDGDYYLPDFLMNSDIWKIGNTVIIHMLQAVFILLILATIIWESPYTGLAATVVGIINFGIYMFTKLQYDVLIHSLESLRTLLMMADMICQDGEELEIDQCQIENAREMRKLVKKIVGWGCRRSTAIYGDMNSMFADFIMGITLIDLSMFNYLVKEIAGKQDKIMKLYELVGEVDIALSIIEFREKCPVWCSPDGNDGETIKKMKMNSLVHPLLNRPVDNDFVLDRRALITGANASGKSTFMKAIAINAIMAQTINTCTAEYFCLPPMDIVTSMALRDDIESKESYYMREAKRIAQMLEENDRERLIVIDEILKGTNTDERIAASIGILEYMGKCKDYILVATHDRELVEELGEEYRTYYFESFVDQEDIRFEYKIKEGKGGKSNAIALLSLLGYPKIIVERAKARIGEENANRTGSKRDRAYA